MATSKRPQNLPRKRFADHSQRWQRQQLRAGVNPQRFDRWLALSLKTRQGSDPLTYGRGVSIAQQRRQGNERAAHEVMLRLPDVREATIIRGLAQMSPRHLRWTANATPDQIRERARQKPERYGYSQRNPWWYR